MSEGTPNQSVLLLRAANRLSRDGGFVAAAFRDWSGDELDLEAVACELACDISAVVYAALCRKPRPDSFGTDVKAIAESAGVDALRLGTLLRQAASISAFRSGAGGQLLAAARDSADEDKDPTS